MFTLLFSRPLWLCCRLCWVAQFRETYLLILDFVWWCCRQAVLERGVCSGKENLIYDLFIFVCLLLVVSVHATWTLLLAVVSMPLVQATVLSCLSYRTPRRLRRPCKQIASGRPTNRSVVRSRRWSSNDCVVLCLCATRIFVGVFTLRMWRCLYNALTKVEQEENMEKMGQLFVQGAKNYTRKMRKNA